MSEIESTEAYVVVVNEEEQWSIWPLHKKVPEGWKLGDKKGNKEECLEFIKSVWIDMRPLSLRKKMDGYKDKVAIAELSEQ
ncbi:MbtH family NRPS accessory protein [Pseudovibrio sp. Tun.PSC04-5.I4]|uniref:MbtH family protein n=1 Tax=Pseudovibrio sp. Tun.PSC04-5.I4 TaxID=1798213 RepID=UPI000884F8BB|nr:MbtH family NRPS accessory protein [Pseudovibrio sp. Tun.PSC04-5.I4]SDR46780.1 MbtH protein [Pseudovibrio sp. Tun.PSC04-5.I4]